MATVRQGHLEKTICPFLNPLNFIKGWKPSHRKTSTFTYRAFFHIRSPRNMTLWKNYPCLCFLWLNVFSYPAPVRCSNLNGFLHWVSVFLPPRRLLWFMWMEESPEGMTKMEAVGPASSARIYYADTLPDRTSNGFRISWAKILSWTNIFYR